MKNGTALAAGRKPNPAVVVFDNRTAYGKAHAHTVFFGRKHRFENLSEVGGTNSSSGILDRYLHKIGSFHSGRYGQYSRLHRPH